MKIEETSEILPPSTLCHRQKYLKNVVTKSLFTDDEIITPHPRFIDATRNIRLKRCSKIEINVPLYMDRNTIGRPTKDEPYVNNIYMDSMAFSSS